ncbi:MAG TPA: ATP-binding protein [Candidatus Anoxymicrobiaceae bacterium]
MTKTSSPTSPDEVRRLVVDLPCGKKSLARARQKVIKFALEHGFSAEAEDVALATQEALKNIIQHACPADNNMHFECVANEDHLLIDITDEGSGFDTSMLEVTPSQPLALHGRGIPLIKGLMDEVWITSDQDGTVVHMEKKRAPVK